MKNLVFIFGFFFSFFSAEAQSMFQINDLIDQNKRKEARKLLKTAIENKATKVEAGLTLILLNSLEQKSGNDEILKEILPEMKNPSEYLFPLWFDNAVVDGYGKKSKNRLKYLKELQKDPRLNESIKTAINYMIAHHFQMSNDIKSARTYWEKTQSIDDWAFAGPFDNASGSGFYKDFEPLRKPESTAMFKNVYNSDISWFTPKNQQTDVYVSPQSFIDYSQGVIYAQNFINSPIEQEVILSIGVGGSFKAFVNDALVLSEEDEVKSELDVYKVKVKLNSGYNRILIQNCFTSKSENSYFSVRFLDQNLNPVEGLTVKTKYQPYIKSVQTQSLKPIPHFAEAYFENKIKTDPGNPLNYIFLSKVHYRKNKFTDAIRVLKKGLKGHENNLLIHIELVLNYLKIDDRTEFLKGFELLRQIDNELQFVYEYDFEIEMGSENYDTAEEKLNLVKKMEEVISAQTLDREIKLAAAKNDNSKILDLVNKAARKFPDEATFALYKFNVLKNISRNSEEPIRFLENYLKDTYNHGVFLAYKNALEETGKRFKLEKLMKEHLQKYPYEKQSINFLSNYFFKSEEYKTALEYVDEGLQNMPFSPNFWNDRAFINESLGNKKEAISDLEKAIHYGPNLFESREKLRELKGESPIANLFAKEGVEEFLEKKAKEPIPEGIEHNYKVLFKEYNYWMHPQGALSRYSYYALKVLNKAGIDEWKQANLSSSGNENITIEKAELVKPSGQKIMAERNGGEMVFTSLEVGDVIYFKYKTDIYLTGNFNEDLWLDFLFSDFVPTERAVLRLFAPKELEILIKEVNLEKPHKEILKGDYIGREWIVLDVPAIKSESLMPKLMKVGKGVHLSTVSSWDEIAKWYYDKAMPLAKEDYNLDEIYNEIFSKKSLNDDYEKAAAIYDYIQSNIRYSSVSFMQSGYVPQKPMVTISNKLGDCKDVSLLYHTLAKKAGINTNLVLVLTSDNGHDNLMLPQSDFNHCIIKIDLPNRTLFQELTDSKLPFGVTPGSIENAQGLVIPNKPGDKVKSDLISIPSAGSPENNFVRNSEIVVESSQLKVKTKIEISGAYSSNYRHHFSGITDDEIKEKIIDLHDRPFKNNPKLIDHELSNLDGSEISFTNSASLTVENEAAKIGGMYALKLPVFTNIISPKDLPDEERIHSYRFYDFENFEKYETSLVIKLSEGQKFIEIPDDFSIKNEVIDYKLKFEKINESELKVIRTSILNREMLSNKQYLEFRGIAKKIGEAEDVFVAYK